MILVKDSRHNLSQRHISNSYSDSPVATLWQFILTRASFPKPTRLRITSDTALELCRESPQLLTTVLTRPLTPSCFL